MGCDQRQRLATGRRLWMNSFPATLVLLAVLFPGAGAVAGNTACDTLINQAVETGETYRVTISIQKKTVRIVTAKGRVCHESISTWASRKLPVAGEETKSSTASRSPSLPDSEEKAVAPRLPPKKPPCFRRLDRFWKQGGYTIKGESYWLVQVYTIDMDDDGWVDDVGFRFNSEGRKDILLRYSGPSGKLTAKLLPGLKLPDDVEISQFCFGELSFEIPEAVPSAPIVSNLATEVAQRIVVGKEAGKQAAKQADDAPEEKPTGNLARILAGAFLAVLIVIGIAAFLTRDRWLAMIKKHGGDETGEDNDDNDDDDDV